MIKTRIRYFKGKSLIMFLSVPHLPVPSFGAQPFRSVSLVAIWPIAEVSTLGCL